MNLKAGQYKIIRLGNLCRIHEIFANGSFHQIRDIDRSKPGFVTVHFDDFQSSKTFAAGDTVCVKPYKK